jgi:hypothetical protein
MNASRCISGLAYAASVFFSAGLRAQSAADLALNTTVRVWHGTPTIDVVRGRLQRGDSASLAIASGRDGSVIRRVSLRDVTRFEYIGSLRTPAQAARRGMWWGAATGLSATTMLTLAAVVSGSRRSECASRCWLLSREGAARTGLGISALSVAVGNVIGRRHRARWFRASLPHEPLR